GLRLRSGESGESGESGAGQVATGAPSNQPDTSASRSTDTLPVKQTVPAGLTGATTALARVWPAPKFTLEVSGRSPHGNATSQPSARALVAVRLRMTAPTPVWGTPCLPV